MMKRHLVCVACALILIGISGVLPVAAAGTGSLGATANDGATAGLNVPQTAVLPVLQQQPGYDPVLGGMIAQVSESEISRTIADLQRYPTRAYPSAGNSEAATYLSNRLAAIPGLEVAYQGGGYRNVIATLPGTDSASGRVVVVGAHYDSHASDSATAPGATDNGAGVAIVLELARVMSANRFDDDIQFAFWNAEEEGLAGSTAYVASASEASRDIPLYLNYDSSGYDPANRYVLDIMYDGESRPFAEVMTRDNSLYGIGFDLTSNVHDCGSDYVPFRRAGYPAITTHTQKHAPEVHTGDDTIELVSLSYARKNAQLGMLLLADTATAGADEDGLQAMVLPGGDGAPRDLDGDGMYEDVNGDGRADPADAALYHDEMSLIAAKEPVEGFDYNENGRIDFADVVWLVNHL